MHRENIKSFAIAMVTALGFLLATVPVASAQMVTQCTGTIYDGRTINSNLVVPAPGCTLTNVTVVGNVLVGTGATLIVMPATGQTVTIDGNIATGQCQAVSLNTQLGGVISVGGTVNIQGCTNAFYFAGSGTVTIGGNFVCTNTSDACIADGGVVRGNLTVDNNSVSVGIQLVGNRISGNVDVSSNNSSSGGILIEDNMIGGNLQCSSNNPLPVAETGHQNKVSGHKEGQCISL
jgi:hypothetical protein